MLTDSERAWLNDREIFLAASGHYIWDSYYWDEGLPLEDMKEAAEFEARVVAKLAKYAARLSWNIGCNDCPAHKACTRSENRNIACGDVFLKAAYLAVEKEMNDDKLDG